MARIHCPDHLKDVISKAIQCLHYKGQSVTLTVNEEGTVEIYYAYTNQLVLTAPPALSVKEAKLQCFEYGDRASRASAWHGTEVWVQYTVKRIDAKDKLICSPIDRFGRVDWTIELVFKPEELVLIQAFKDYLLHGLDLSTISEDWAELYKCRQLRDALDKKMIELKAEEAKLEKKRMNAKKRESTKS